jgi:hypothetical protein
LFAIGLFCLSEYDNTPSGRINPIFALNPFVNELTRKTSALFDESEVIRKLESAFYFNKCKNAIEKAVGMY